MTKEQFDALTPEQQKAMAQKQFDNANDALELYLGSLPGIVDSRRGDLLAQWSILSAALFTAMKKAKAGPQMVCMILAAALLALHEQ